MRFSNEEIYSSEKIKYICQTERKNSPRIEFLERKQQRNRERDENSERLWPLVLRLIRRKKKLCLGFSFFFKGKSIKFFF